MTERILVAGGTPKQIVDKLEQWHFETGANGGFMLARGFSAPGNLQEFVDLVVPELQRRGLSKKKYAGATLRDNLLHDAWALIASTGYCLHRPAASTARDRSANPLESRQPSSSGVLPTASTLRSPMSLIDLGVVADRP